VLNLEQLVTGKGIGNIRFNSNYVCVPRRVRSEVRCAILYSRYCTFTAYFLPLTAYCLPHGWVIYQLFQIEKLALFQI
jgi:hypothetical protein